MAIVKENYKIGRMSFTYTYSDQDFYIERDGVEYVDAIDPTHFNREYTETDKKIPTDEHEEPEEEGEENDN